MAPPRCPKPRTRDPAAGGCAALAFAKGAGGLDAIGGGGAELGFGRGNRRRLGLAETHDSLIWQSVMCRPGKMRFIGMKNPLPIGRP
jgi:hypothetical protein